ncbi:uncharacterized protein [Montipora capricornis]|uniref:uncharacterized protein isoform X1 n=1 Tax=Montipora capricornis TaxID=246305 RepID=UPI0035F21426
MGGTESSLNGAETDAQETEGGMETGCEQGTRETIQSKPDTKQDSKATGSVQEKNKMTDKPQNGKNRALLPATRRVVSQVNVMKTLLASYKRNTDFKSEYVTIEFAKRPEDRAIDMGFLLHGGVDCSIVPGDSGIFVKHVIAGSVADRKLSPGDRILSINGLNVTKVKLTCAQQAVRRAQGMVRLYIKKAPNRQKIIFEAIKKENRRDSSPFSDEDIEDYEDAFSVYDVKGKGNIRVNDVFPLIRSLGHNPLEAAVWCCMNELGLTANRKIKFTEFLRIMASLIVDEARVEHGLDTIRVFDSEERGYINSAELETALRCMPGSRQVTDNELQEILQLVDPDGDGKINIPDFKRLVDHQENVK